MTSGKDLLERILDDGSDSDSDLRQGQSAHVPVHVPRSFRSGRLNTISRLSSLTMDADLERILREADDDEEDDEFMDKDARIQPNDRHFGILLEDSSSNSSSLHQFEVIRSSTTVLDASPKHSLSTLSASVASKPTPSRLMERRLNNTDDWTLLQKIMDEKEDDISQEAAVHNHDLDNTCKVSCQPIPLSKASNPTAVTKYSTLTDVDAILENIGFDDDDDDDESDIAAIAELDDLAARFRSIHASSISATKDSSNFKKKIDSFLDSSFGAVCSNDSTKLRIDSVPSSRTSNLRSTVTSQDDTTPPERDSWTKISTNQRIAVVANKSKSSDSITTMCQATSDAAIKYAESQEARLIRPTSRDVISPLMVKRRMKPKIDLPTKSRLSKNGTFTSTQSNPRYNFAGVIDSKVFPKISSSLMRNIQAGQKDIGLPTALAVNSKFIAIGTQHGYALIFDYFEQMRQKLGLSASGTNMNHIHVSITSLDLSSNGETLIAGYSNGTLILWDIIKGFVMKSVTDLHSSPITGCRFVSDQAMNVVTVDAGGLVNRVVFSKTIWSSVGMESECLLDGTAGQILAMHVLPSFNSLKGASSFEGAGILKKIVLMALTSDRSSFAIAVEPKIHVLHRWPRPSMDRNSGSDTRSTDTAPVITVVPCLAWGWVLISGGENVVTPILARSWGCSLQFLRTIFPPIEEINRGTSDDQNHWPAFGIHDEFEASDPIVALEWLGYRSLVYLTITNEFTIIDSVMMTLTERLDFSGIKLVYAELALSRTALNKEKSPSGSSIITTFLNTVRSNDERILILCREELRAVSILDIHKRVQGLEDDGEWLEALALALDYYETSVKSQEDRKRDPDGKRDLSGHPEFLTRLRLSEDDEWLADLLLRYLFLAVENAPDAAIEPGKRNSIVRFGLSQTHFQMLAGVCIEFCIVSRRLDLLFGQVFEKFQSSGSSSIFFEVLEPYIMNDKLKYVGAEVMAHFVHHCKMNNDLSTVERCLIHMDVTIMDFDSIVSLLRKNSMYSALIHVYTAGLDDFTTPLQILFEAIFDNYELGRFNEMKRTDGMPINLFEQYGYKTILYIRRSLEGKAFPRGDPLKPDNRIDTLRPQLLFFLIQRQSIPVRSNGGGYSVSSKVNSVSLRESKYPYLRALMMLDPKAVFDTISIVFDNPAVRFMKSVESVDLADEWIDHAPKDEQIQDKTTSPDRQEIARILSLIMGDLMMSDSLAPAQFSVDCFHDFLAKYLSQGVIRTPRPLTTNIFSRICAKACRMMLLSERKEAEDFIISLIQKLPPSTFDLDDVLQLLEKSNLTRAALFLHKTGVHHTSHGSSRHFMSVIDCYLQEDDDPCFQREVFTYIQEECSKDHVSQKEDKTSLHSMVKTDRQSLRYSLLEKLPNLVLLDAVQTAQLVTELYVDDLDLVLQTLDRDEGQLVYSFLQSVINGELTKINPYAGPLLHSSLTIAHYRRYLELMAKFNPELVYKYLLTHDNYRLDECLKLCQSQDIPDASAYLLERLGNVSSGLQLLLQTLEGRLMILKRKIRSVNLVSYSTDCTSPQTTLRHVNEKDTEGITNVMKTSEFQNTKLILDAVLDLCERNSNSQVAGGENGSHLWLNLVDRLMNAKLFLRPQKEKEEHIQILLHIVSDLLHTTLQRMIKRVTLSELMQMIISDQATHRLSDLRDMVSVMLQVYGSEAHLYLDAVHVLHSDVHSMVVMKHNLKRCAVKALDSIKSTAGFLQRNDGFRPPDINDLSDVIINVSHDGDVVLLRSNNIECKASDEPKMYLGNRTVSNNRQRKVLGLSNLSSFGKTMRTKTDMLFDMGLSSEAACVTRHYGIISHSEHFGRLAWN